MNNHLKIMSAIKTTTRLFLMIYEGFLIVRNHGAWYTEKKN